MSFKPIKVMDVELSNPLEDLNDLDSYGALKTLLRFYGTPIGYVQLPLHGGRCTARALGKAILDQHSRTIINHLLRIGLAEPLPPDGLRIADLVNMSPPIDNGPLLLVTVAVCTRNRTADLSLCLESLSCLDYPSLEILVVDNAPSTDATEKLVRTRYPNVRYVCEPRPGLDWARNRAIAEARGEIIAYTDDDVVVDPGWISAIVLVFSENLDVMAVTGLIVPYELETEAQILFEKYGGFGRGFERKWYRLDRESKKTEKYHIGSGIFGTGANMAYRRSLFEQLGGFDPALDVGTVTNGGGDLEMFFRVLQEGHTLVYEPNAVVRHRHCRKYDQLRIQLTNYGIGLYSYFVRAALAYPRERLGVLRLGLWWLWWWSMRRLLISFVFPARFPRDLILAEYRGSFLGLVRYFKARRIAKKIARRFNRVKTFTPKSQLGTPIVLTDHFDKLRAGSAKRSVESCDAWSERPLANSLLRGDQVSYPYPAAIRMVELCRPLQPLTDVKEYKNVRIFVTLGGRLLGMVNIFNNRQNIGVTRLKDAIVENLACELLEPGHYESKEFIWSKALAALKKRYLPPEGESTTLSADVSVSVVVATYDRPEDLRLCLRSLMALETPRRVEIIVVDNHPASGLTPSVVEEFPGVVLVREWRKGLSYARNAGIAASTGDIVVAVDDDVAVPPDWLEKLVAPFSENGVMAVTGNVLPLELETHAQHLYEAYGGLGRGFARLEVNGDWFSSFKYTAVPTWKLGATANAAFHSAIFSDPEVGLMEEALGPGRPSGIGEDTYLFYKILRAGYTLVYEPNAYVWHKHRRDMKALLKQIYNYSKGHVAYHLMTLLRDGDRRAIVRLLFELPLAHLFRISQRLRRRSLYPVSMSMLEIIANLVGPLALWRSHRSVQREGRSRQYIPVPQRRVILNQLPHSDAFSKIHRQETIVV